MIIPTILLNGVAVVTILRSSQLSSKPCYFIILLQSVFDFAVGVLGIPLFIFFLANPVAEISNCSFAMSFTRILMFAPILGSSIALIAMTFERYIAILHPFAYKSLVTKKRLMKYVGANTMLEFLVIFGSFTAKRLFHLYVMVKVTLILLLTAYAYTRICMVVKKLACSQKKPRDVVEGRRVTKTKLFVKEIRQARSCFIVVICFFMLGFLPATITTNFSSDMDRFQELAMVVWVFSLAITNSSVNSLIFFWTKIILRKEALKAFSAE